MLHRVEKLPNYH